MDDPAREICLCFHVSLGKLVRFYERHHPTVASRFSECHGAGQGCGWCVPYLEKLFEQLQAGKAPEIGMDYEEYRARRIQYHKTRKPDLPPPPDADGPLDLDLENVLNEVPDDLKLD